MRWILAIAISLLPCSAQDMTARARRLQSEAIGIDSHIDTMQRVLIEHIDLSKRLPDGQVDLPRLREGGMHAPFFALWVPTYYQGSEAVRRTLELRDAAQSLLDRYPTEIELATTAAEVRRIVSARKIAAVLTLEGGHQIADDLAVLRIYHLLGIRAMTLTHFRNNNWADSSTDKPRHNGLTDFGRQVVREMNRLGMLVDVSHVSDQTFFDALAVTAKPVIASHSSCRALANSPRNLTDQMLKALARNGGVVGISFYPGFLHPKDIAARSAIAGMPKDIELTGTALDQFAAKSHLEEFRKLRPAAATIDDVVAHIDHAVKVAGIDHVGIGSDWDGIGSVPNGLEDVSKMPELTAALLKQGYSEAAIRKIMGENLLRVMRDVIGR